MEDNGDNHIKGSLIICNFHRTMSGQQNYGRWNWRHIQ